MKKLLTVLFLLLFAGFGTMKAQALSFEEALQSKNPSAVLIYAPWAENADTTVTAFDSLAGVYGQKYNFVKIDIAAEDAKSFNKTNYIYPNLPYVLLFKERGRMSRCITRDCLTNDTCIKEKMDLFAN